MKADPGKLCEWLRMALIYAENTNRPTTVQEIRDFIDEIQKEIALKSEKV